MIDYVLSGKRPQTLFSTGVHGNEFVLLPLVSETLKKYKKKLPPFLYIPKVSPSALAMGERKNKDNVDLNKSFFRDDIEEVNQVKKLVEEHKFDLMVDFHEDLVVDGFYVYDLNKDEKETPLALEILAKVRALGVPLWSGLDDPVAVNPNLGNQVVNGYCRPAWDKLDISFDGWMRNQSKVEAALVPEIPGLQPLGIKLKIVEIIIKGIIETG